MSAWEAPGKSDEWYTPPEVFEALGCVFDLDVAHPMHGNTHVPCRNWLYERSLEQIWHGFIWMNPPFGGRNALGPWLDKFFAHGNGIALVPDRTSAPWFQDTFARANMALFTRKFKFNRPDGSRGEQPGNGTALLAAGARAETALLRAAERGFGIAARPILLSGGQ